MMTTSRLIAASTDVSISPSHPRPKGTAGDEDGQRSGDEVLRLGVVADDGVGRLFGDELEPVAHAHPDAVATEQLDHLGVVLQVRAGGVAPAVAAAAVLLAEQPCQGGPVLVGEPQLLAD